MDDINKIHEKDHEQNLIEVPRSTVHVITHLPLPPLVDYSPYEGLEFDQSVLDFCRSNFNSRAGQLTFEDRNRINGNLFKSYRTLSKIPFTYKTARSCKVVVSGDVAVGKTCLVNRFGHDIYTNKYQTTIGVDFDIQKFNILGQPYVLQIWDTAGLERFKCITSSYYRGCQAALLVFDMSNLSTLANVIRWKEEVLSSSKTFDQMLANQNSPNPDETIKDPSLPLLFLVGTKSDLPIADSTRQFIREQANKIANLLQAELWFVSAQTGENVNELFNRVASLTFNRNIQSEVQRIKFESSTLGANLKEKIIQQQKELWLKSSKLIKITKRKDGDDRRTRCINVQCVIR